MAKTMAGLQAIWPQARTGQSNRTRGQKAIIGTNLVLIGTCLFLAFFLNYAYSKVASVNRVEVDSLTPLASAVPGQRQFNVLLVGSDSAAELDSEDPIQVGRNGENFGDVIIIAHLDERSGDIALLSIPRDLWVPIAGIGREGKINKAFEMGGPTTLIDTIESEFGIPIHHYMNVDFAGFKGVVSSVESVDVYFETPARDWNARANPPRSQTGFIVEQSGCVSLEADEALAYVRSRYYQTQDAEGNWVTDPTSDLGRIKRQQDFLKRLSSKAIEKGARNPLVLREMIESTLPHISIDQGLTMQMLLDVSSGYRSFRPDDLQTYSFPAVDARVGSSQVLLPVQSDLEPLVKLFNGEAFDAPGTIAVTVISDSGSGAPEAAILAQHGFIVSEKSGSSANSSSSAIQHGPNGLAVANTVSKVLGSDYELKSSRSGGGRSVTVLSEDLIVGLSAPKKRTATQPKLGVQATSVDISLAVAPARLRDVSLETAESTGQAEELSAAQPEAGSC